MAPESPKPDNVINLPTGDALKKHVEQQLQPKPEPQPEQPQQEMHPREAFLHELVAVIQAAEALRENKTHSVRTQALDIEAEQAKRLINQFLSKNAYDAIHAMEFMHMVMPQMVGNIGAIFAQHRMTYMPLVDTLNGIAMAKRKAMEEAKAAQKEESDGKATE